MMASREYPTRDLKGGQLRTQFLNAVKRCQPTELREILKNPKVDVNLRIRSGMTPLMHAAEKANAECVNILIESGADVNLADINHRTALMYAVQCASTECIRLLLEAKADVNACSRVQETCLFEAISSGNETCVKLLCESGADVNKTNNVGNSPFTFAVIYGRIEMIKCLVSFGADVDIRNSEGQTALMLAVNHKKLLRFGKGVMRTYVKRKENPGCVKVLLELGADVNAKDNYGKTALFLASVRGYVDCVRLLLKENADLAPCDHTKTKFSPHEWTDPITIEENCRELLYAAGKIESSLYTADFQELYAIDCRSNLKHICREIIRERLSSNHPDCNLFSIVNQLPLPGSLKSYLLYNLL